MPIPSSLALVPLAVVATVVSLRAQPPVQYRAPSGTEYRALPDSEPVVRARAALAPAPRDVDRVIALATAQSVTRRFREAIATLTEGLASAPDDARLLRWRGHRRITVRDFSGAEADLVRGLAIDSTNYGILFHLGVLRFVQGRHAEAASLFARAQPRAPDGGELAGSTDWLWMSLSRAGRGADAAAMLARRPDSLPAPPGYAYVSRLRLYRGEVAPEALLGPADTADVQRATLEFGRGNWWLVRGDTVRARAAFERAVASGGWPGFGAIVAEAELARLGCRGRR